MFSSFSNFEFFKQDELRANPNYMVNKNKLVASGALIMGGGQTSQVSQSEVGFGRANRPSTPIKGVLSYNFGNQAEYEIN